MDNKIKVLIVDDHEIIRDGLVNMLNCAEDIECFATAVNGYDALNIIKQNRPNVLVSDISMAEMNGIELTHIISKEYPDIKVLILTMYTNEDFIFNVIRAGAKGVLPKQETNAKVLLEAIRTLAQGNEYFSNEISKIVVKSLIIHGKGNETPEMSTIFKITSREKEILKLFANGMSNAQIAKELNISIRTVETHKNNIMQKFNFKTTVEMVKFAIRNNIVSID